ncbi:MAG TPA: LolA-related protein, partial [Methylophilaceae bacterium]|nr:LolA-related protein [Methylophilaceae bacterium]
MARAEEWSVSELMEAMSQTRMARAKFVEQKNISMLEQPIESSGELFYTAPDRLEKRTLQPKAESMQLEGSTLWIISEGKSHVLQLSRYPEIAAFIDSIRGLLSGDRKALERSYQLQLSGKKTAWTLILEPKNPRVQKVLLRIEIEGAQT